MVAAEIVGKANPKRKEERSRGVGERFWEKEKERKKSRKEEKRKAEGKREGRESLEQESIG